MPSDSFCLAAQARLDSKWLKTDIQVGFCTYLSIGVFLPPYLNIWLSLSLGYVKGRKSDLAILEKPVYFLLIKMYLLLYQFLLLFL